MNKNQKIAHIVQNKNTTLQTVYSVGWYFDIIKLIIVSIRYNFGS